MLNTGSYDVLLQFQPDVLNELIARVLDDPLTTALQSPFFVPKQLAFPPPPQQPKVLLWWEQPSFSVEDRGSTTPSVAVTVPVHGGVQVQSSIYSVEGEVQIGRPARLA